MSNDEVVVDGHLTWDVVHLQLTQIAKRRAALDAEEARWLRRAEALQIWKPLGMVSALDYLERTLGYAPHAAHERLRVARSLGDLPVLERAFAEGRLGFTAVRELTRVATPATEPAWVGAALGKSLREIEPIVANHQPGDLPDDPPTPELRTRRVSFDLPPETYAVLRQARLVLDEEHGRRLASHELIDVLARRAIAAAPVSESTGRATYQLAVTVCERCNQGWQEGGGELVPVGPAVVERAACDAQRIGSIADVAQARVKASQDVPPAVVRFVYRRDHGRCRVTGCRSTRCLEIHHIIHRANGGTHDVWNTILTCSSCHRAHHDGRLVISGTADKLEVVRPAEARSHGGPASPLADAIAHAQAKSTLVRLGWKAGGARAAIDRVTAELRRDATAEAIVRAALKLDPATSQDWMKWLVPSSTRWRMIVSQRIAQQRLGRRRRPAVQHLAIDLGGRESQICVRDQTTKILEERRHPTRRLGEYLAKQPPSRVILETSAEAFAVADAARAAGHDVRVVPATLARTLGVGAHGIKTDRRDAQALSEVSCKVDLRSVHIPSAQARQWRALLSSRDALVSARTKLVNTLRSQLRGRLVQLGKRLSGTTPRRLRELWIEIDGTVPPHVERLLIVVEELTKQVNVATREVGLLAKGHEVCRRLMTVPGVGCVTAVRFVATIDDATRFSTAHGLQSYLGLTPGENSSSMRLRRTRLTKAGSPQMRWLLVQAAWTTRRVAANQPIGVWAKRIADRRGGAIATVAVARKLAGVMFAMWRDQTNYNPMRGAAMRGAA